MARTFPGRYSARIEGDFVVFLIGMRINRPWKVQRWWPVAAAIRSASPGRRRAGPCRHPPKSTPSSASAGSGR